VFKTLSIPLSTPWTNKTVQIREVENNNRRPFRSRPTLWASGDSIYSYWGVGPVTNIWQLVPDTSGGGVWDQTDEAAPPDLTEALVDASCSSANQVVYCYGGLNTTIKPFSFALSPRLISYNFTTIPGTWQEDTSHDPHEVPVGGVSRTIPDLGSQGLFFSIGGHRTSTVGAESRYFYNSNEQVSMDTVELYDATTKKWYSQRTTGRPPGPRAYACSALAKSAEGSYELYASVSGCQLPSKTY
jgi:hypothetical protein